MPHYGIFRHTIRRTPDVLTGLVMIKFVKPLLAFLILVAFIFAMKVLPFQDWLQPVFEVIQSITGLAVMPCTTTERMTIATTSSQTVVMPVKSV